MIIYLYKCPDCGLDFSADQIHQHQNGEWVSGEDLRRYYQTKSWKTKSNDIKWTIEQLYYALERSVKLQSHYGKLLNEYDGGFRITFKDAKEWLERLESLGDLK